QALIVIWQIPSCSASKSLEIRPFLFVLCHQLLFDRRNHRMHSFSEQCLDMARSMLGHNLNSIQPDGTVLPANDEQSRPDEPGHVAFALGEVYRATGSPA